MNITFRDCVFRSATVEDIPQILDIDVSVLYNLPNGFKTDYLPFCIESWMKDENRINSVLTFNGKVICFQSFLVSDNGKLLLSQSWRSRKK